MTYKEYTCSGKAKDKGHHTEEAGHSQASDASLADGSSSAEGTRKKEGASDEEHLADKGDKNAAEVMHGGNQGEYVVASSSHLITDQQT